MKPTVWVAISLILLGVIGLAYQGFTYTHREKILDIGPLHATEEKHDWISIPPVLGGIAVVAGVVLLAASGKRNS
jgi:hypothetical protein